jgi:hypothetical protein
MRLKIDERDTVKGRGVTAAARRALEDLLERKVSQVDIQWSRSILSRLYIYRGANSGAIFVYRFDNSTQRAYLLIEDIHPELLRRILAASLARSKNDLAAYRWRPSRPLKPIPKRVVVRIKAIAIGIALLWAYVDFPIVAFAVFFGCTLETLYFILLFGRARRARRLRAYRYGVGALWFPVETSLRFAYYGGVAFFHAKLPYMWLMLSISCVFFAALMALGLNSEFRSQIPRVRTPREQLTTRSLSGQIKRFFVIVAFLALWFYCWQASLRTQFTFVENLSLPP